MHILHLEDCVADADLIQTRLRSRWPDCTFTTLGTRAAFESAVRRGDFDLVLSDYSLPDYDGRRALTFVRDNYPDKPFIYLSGTIGEERAIEALKAGANDYLLKDRPGRLVAAIDAALIQVKQTEAHREAEEKIREQASLLDKSREAICVIDGDGRVTYWNASAERLYGWSAADACGRDLREMLYGAQHLSFDAAHAHVLAEGEWRGELGPQPRQGEPVRVESFWSLVTDHAGLAKAILIMDVDTTERKKMENQLLQAQRLETLGVLVGGIAHDLNNILAPILTALDLMRERSRCTDDRELLSIMDESAHLGADLVRQLLAFARGKGGQRGEVGVDVLIGSVQKLLQTSMPPNIELRAPMENELWSIHADATQLRQVLLNLCLNARDAMPQGGSIEIRARDVQVDRSTRSVQGEVRPGSYVCISVADTGAGIPAEHVGKLFDPSFTTKQIGKGTGLGLANVAAIVKSHGGFLGLDNQPGIGATFHVYLPAASRGAGETMGVVPHWPLQGHGERILVVEADDDMRTILEVILSTGGYRVTAAATGENGLEQIRMQPDAFAAVITGLDLPGTSGAEVLHRIRALPSPPKLVALRNTNDGAHDGSSAFTGIEYLSKPLTPDHVLGTLRRIIASSSGSNRQGTATRMKPAA